MSIYFDNEGNLTITPASDKQFAAAQSEVLDNDVLTDTEKIHRLSMLSKAKEEHIAQAAEVVKNVPSLKNRLGGLGKKALTPAKAVARTTGATVKVLGDKMEDRKALNTFERFERAHMIEAGHKLLDAMQAKTEKTEEVKGDD